MTTPQLSFRLPHLLKDCSRRQLDQIHGLLLTSSSLHRLPGLPAFLVRRATELGDMAHADLLFSSFRGSPDVALYNALIRGCAYHGPHGRALDLFDEMLSRGLAPDSFTYPYVVDACARLRVWQGGQAVHCRVVKEGIDVVPAVGSSLLAFNVAGGSLGDARRVFDGFAVKSVGLSNRMMSEYIKVADTNSARGLFDAMVDKDVVSWNSMLGAYVKAGDIVAAKELFSRMPVKNIVSWTTMLRALSDVGDFIGMRSHFNRMPERNLVSWNCILSSYTRHGRFWQALQMFPRMLLEGLTPDSYTVVSVLSACENLGKLRMGRWIHVNLVNPALQVHAEVGTALVEMYAMCGDTARAMVVFFKMDSKDVFSWNVIIRALAVHRQVDDAFRIFDLMRKQGFLPNHFTFMGVLLACRYGALVDEGRKIFDVMQMDYGIRPSLQHYICLIDLLASNCRVDEAVTVLRGMPCQPDSEIWRLLLGSCRIQVGLGSAEEVTGNVIQSSGDEIGLGSAEEATGDVIQSSGDETCVTLT